MPRRALRKLDPTLDLSGHYREVQELAAPFDPATLFGKTAPLEIELGSGKGLFLATAAASRPDVNFLGLEVARKYARYIAGKLVRQGLTNASVVQGDGLLLFRDLLPPDCAAAVHVYFPDPWWKKRHKKRRVMNAPFLADAQRALVPGGALHFWTDVEEYFHVTLELIAAATQLAGPFDVAEQPAAGEFDYRTHFERRTRQNGLPVYRAEFRKAER
jgi:tRNA (guanine-N7-)-methyltransferase